MIGNVVVNAPIGLDRFKYEFKILPALTAFVRIKRVRRLRPGGAAGTEQSRAEDEEKDAISHNGSSLNSRWPVRQRHAEPPRADRLVPAREFPGISNRSARRRFWLAPTIERRGRSCFAALGTSPHRKESPRHSFAVIPKGR